MNDKLTIVKLFKNVIFEYVNGKYVDDIIILDDNDDHIRMNNTIQTYLTYFNIKCDKIHYCHYCKTTVLEIGDGIFCPCCINTLTNIIGNNPICHINLSCFGTLVKLPVFGYMNDDIVVREGSLIGTWRFYINTQNIYDNINFTQICDKMIRNGEISEADLDDGDKSCDMCGIMRGFVLDYDRSNVCYYCIIEYDIFYKRMFSIYLLFGDILVADVRMGIVRRVIGIYAMLS